MPVKLNGQKFLSRLCGGEFVLRKANCFVGGAVAYALYNKENNKKESILFALCDVKKIANYDRDFEEHLLIK